MKEIIIKPLTPRVRSIWAFDIADTRACASSAAIESLLNPELATPTRAPTPHEVARGEKLSHAIASGKPCH